MDIESDSSEAHWQRLANKTAARRMLAELKRTERIAESVDRLGSRTDLSEWRIALLQRIRREQYRSATGIDLEEREAVRSLAEELAETGAEPIDAAVRDLRLRLYEPLNS